MANTGQDSQKKKISVKDDSNLVLPQECIRAICF